MVPQGPPPPLGGTQQVPPSLLRSSSGLLGGQAGSQNVFPSLLSPQNQFNNMNMLGNVPNVSSLLHPSFGNGGPSTGFSGPGQSQRGLMDGGAESDPLSGQGQGRPQFSNPLMALQQSQHLNSQNLANSQQQFSVPGNSQQPQQFQGTVPNVGPIKLEPQANGDQTPQQLQALGNVSQVKLEQQQLQSMRSSGPVKMEPQDPSLFLQQQQQQLLLSRQLPQTAAAAHLLRQQRLMQMQQQQQQLLNAMPQQRSPVQSQIHLQNLPIRPPVKPVYEPGMCARRLTHYMYQQQHRPEDNSIEFWRKFVAEYFAPNAKKKWCISMYGNGRQTTGVLPQETWQCEICNRKPGRGFEATVEVLPRLFKIKYESGTLEELLYVDMPREYQNSSGQIVLDYAKAIQESVFEQLRVVRDGQLRIVFSPDLKICSWEFCARRHEELIPRRLLIPQASQVGAAAQKCQANNAQNSSSSNNSVSELQNNCNMFVASARQLAKSLEVPLVNDLGYTKRYVRCLQISEVVNSMKDLIDYSHETGTGPTESLTKFPRRKNPSSGFQGHPQQTEGPTQQEQQQQTLSQSSNHDNNPAQASNPQLSVTTNGMPNVNNAINSSPITSSSAIAGLLHQNSMNSRQQTSSPNDNNPAQASNSQLSGSSSIPYAGNNNIQMPSPGSSSTVPQAHPAQSNVQTSTPPSANIGQPTSHGGSLTGNPINRVASPNISIQQQPSLSGDDANDPQSSVQKIIHDMMISSQLSNNGGGMVGMGGKNVNGMLLSANKVTGINGSHVVLGSNCNAVMGGSGFGSSNGIQSNVGNNSLSVNGMSMANQQLLSGLGAVNGFNNLHFDWKASP